MKATREFIRPIEASHHLQALARIAGIASSAPSAPAGYRLAALFLPGFTLNHSKLQTRPYTGRER